MKYPKELKKWINRLRKRLRPKNGVMWWDSPEFERKMNKSKINRRKRKYIPKNIVEL